MKATAEVTEGRELFFFLRNRGKRAENEREERDGSEDIILIYIILFYKYIILMSKEKNRILRCGGIVK